MNSIHTRYILAAALGIGGALAAGATAEPMNRARNSGNALNAVDRPARSASADLVTADQQGHSVDEADTTRRIREALMNDPSLSMSAKNVTVITRGGTVTLRGWLASTAESRRVEQIAKEKAGTHNIVNATKVR